MTLKCSACGYDNPDTEDRCVQCLHTLMQREVVLGKTRADPEVLFRKPVSELLTGLDLLVCSPDDSVEKIVKVFQKFKKACVLVYSRKKLVGILSNRDLLLRVAGRYKDLSKVKIEEVMTKNPGYVMADDPIAFAVNKMSLGGYRDVPVLRADGTPVSILLIKDVLRYLSKSKKSY